MRTNGASAGITVAPGSGPQRQFTIAHPPPDLAEIIAELRRLCATAHSPVLTFHEARRAIMRTSTYKDHQNLAQAVLNYLRLEGVGVLVPGGDGKGLIFNDPDAPLAAAAIAALRQTGKLPAKDEPRPKPSAAACHVQLVSSVTAGTLSPQLTHRQALDFFIASFGISEGAAVDLISELIEMEWLRPIDTTGRLLRVRAELPESPRVTAPTAPIAAPAVKSSAPASAAKARRITRLESEIISELVGLHEVEHLYRWLAERLGNGRATQSTYRAFVDTLRIVVPVIAEDGTKGRFRVDHSAIDQLNFVVDDTLPRAKFATPPAARPTPKPAAAPAEPVAVVAGATPPAPTDSLNLPDALSRIDQEIAELRATDTKLDQARARESMLAEELATTRKTVAMLTHQYAERHTRLRRLERAKKRIQVRIESLRKELADLAG